MFQSAPGLRRFLGDTHRKMEKRAAHKQGSKRIEIEHVEEGSLADGYRRNSWVWAKDKGVWSISIAAHFNERPVPGIQRHLPNWCFEDIELTRYSTELGEVGKIFTDEQDAKRELAAMVQWFRLQIGWGYSSLRAQERALNI